MKYWLTASLAFISMACGPSLQERRAHYQALKAASDRIDEQWAHICDDNPNCMEGGSHSMYDYLMLEHVHAQQAADAANPDRGY